jgi:ammonia channel protein AmtB
VSLFDRRHVVLLKVLDATMGLRVGAEQEDEGLDA